MIKYELSADAMDLVLKYLNTCPYGQVAHIMRQLEAVIQFTHQKAQGQKLEVVKDEN